MRIISVRENPEVLESAIQYFQQSWPGIRPEIYEDCISHSISAPGPLPQWYLLEKDGDIIGCAGLITNDFISRMDLYPWICALFIEESYRGHNLGSLLVNKAKEDAKKSGFKHVYLSTDFNGYYEKLGFTYVGQGHHPWGDESRIYKAET